MKRLLLATSILALAAGGAFAQSMNSAPPSAPRPLMPSTPSMSAPSGTSTSPAAPSASSSTSSSSSTGSSMTGSASNGGTQASSDDVVRAQQALRQQGLYKGAVDGKIGPETRTAITRFQKQNGLQQTAQLDEPTVGQLEGSGTSPIGGSGARMPSNSGAPSISGSSSGTDKDDDNDAK